MVRPYVLSSIDGGTEPTLTGFCEWLKHVKSENYVAMQTILWTYFLALDMFKSGVRANYSSTVHCALNVFGPLFYVLNMPKYREIRYHYHQIVLNVPDEVNQFLAQNEAFMKGAHTREGGDFVLENINKRIKSWMPPGVPSEKDW